MRSRGGQNSLLAGIGAKIAVTVPSPSAADDRCRHTAACTPHCSTVFNCAFMRIYQNAKRTERQRRQRRRTNTATHCAGHRQRNAVRRELVRSVPHPAKSHCLCSLPCDACICAAAQHQATLAGAGSEAMSTL